MKKVLILGGLGNGSIIAHAIADANKRGYSDLVCAGFVNDRDKVTEIEGFPILGGLSDIPSLLKEDYYFINTIFKIGGQKERIELFENLQIPDERLAIFVHPLAYVAPRVELSPGCVVLANASISPSNKFGKCCRVMVGATIGHNCTFDDYCFFAANSCVGSYLEFGRGVNIGLNACVREYIQIDDFGTAAMGAVVLNNISKGEIWAGNPAKLLKKVE